MFWGVKLERGKQYSQLVDRSFHISHAAVQPESGFYLGPRGSNVVEVHVVVEKTDYLLCYLGIQLCGDNLDLHMIQQPLNLNISEGEEITLYVRKMGVKNEEQQAAAYSVYLTGYFVDEPTFEPDLEDLLGGDEYASEELSSTDEDSEDVLDKDEGRGSGLNGESLATLLLEGSLADSDSEDDADFMADDLLAVGSPSINTRKRLAKPLVVEEIKKDDKDGPGHNSAPPSKCQRSSNVEGGASPSETSVAKMKKSAKKKKKKKEGNSDKKDNKAADSTVSIAGNGSSPKKMKLASFKTPGGTEVQELKIGSGKIAKPGTKVFMKYTGRLAHNNKIFDSNITQKKPFMFRLGQGEVVKGWDEGVKGMKVGGKRKLLIPPKQGYGASGASPHVPPNSKLLFDVELVDVK